MKPGAILINTARGELVDDVALVEALRSERLRGAGLDVFCAVSTPPRPCVAGTANVVMTPSSAWNTADASLRMLRSSIDNVLAFLRGEPASITNNAALGRI